MTAGGRGSGVAVGGGGVAVGETAVLVATVVENGAGDGVKTAVGVAVASCTLVGRLAKSGVGRADGSGVVMATCTDGGK